MSVERDPNSSFDDLVCVAEKTHADYLDVGLAEWAASPLSWIRQVSSAHKRGKIGEAIVATWARSEGLQVDEPHHRGHDWIIAGMRVEVKTSLRWNNNRFVFMQLRDFDYDAVALLGLAPNDFGLWVVSKQLLWEHAKEQRRGVSHAGSKWLSFFADKPPTWLQRRGGSLAEARIALEQTRTHFQQEAAEPSTNESSRDLPPDVDWTWLDEALKVG
jgi:hypothetical protein